MMSENRQVKINLKICKPQLRLVSENLLTCCMILRLVNGYLIVGFSKILSSPQTVHDKFYLNFFYFVKYTVHLRFNYALGNGHEGSALKNLLATL